MSTPNWPQVIKDINATGMTYRDISAALGSSLGAIGDLARGKSRDATYTLGVSLLALHKRKVRRKRRAN